MPHGRNSRTIDLTPVIGHNARLREKVPSVDIEQAIKNGTLDDLTALLQRIQASHSPSYADQQTRQYAAKVDCLIGKSRAMTGRTALEEQREDDCARLKNLETTLRQAREDRDNAVNRARVCTRSISMEWGYVEQLKERVAAVEREVAQLKQKLGVAEQDGNGKAE